MKTVNVYLLRHGKTMGEPALNGQTDVLVASELQSEITNNLLKKGIYFPRICTSHLQRCSDLAENIQKQLKGSSIEVNSALSEMNFGAYDGRSFSSLDDQDWKRLNSFWRDPAKVVLPNAETLGDFYARTTRAWKSIISNLDVDTLVIAHGGTIRMILAYVLDIDWTNPRWVTHLSIDYQSLTHIQVMINENETHFLVKSIGVPLL